MCLKQEKCAPRPSLHQPQGPVNSLSYDKVTEESSERSNSEDTLGTTCSIPCVLNRGRQRPRAHRGLTAELS